MDAAHLSPARVPQRVLVTGAPGRELDDFARRLTAVLDLPLVLPTDLSGPADLARLTAFEGWVTTADQPPVRAPLLDRAEVVVQVLPEVSTLRSLVRRTVRKIRAEAPDPTATWVDALPLSHPDLVVVRLTGEAESTAWLHDLRH